MNQWNAAHLFCFYIQKPSPVFLCFTLRSNRSVTSFNRKNDQSIVANRHLFDIKTEKMRRIPLIIFLVEWNYRTPISIGKKQKYCRHLFDIKTEKMSNMKIKSMQYQLKNSSQIDGAEKHPERDLGESLVLERPKVCKSCQKWWQNASKSINMAARNASKTILEASRQNGERVFEKMVPFWHHLGDFGCNFGPSWAPMGLPKSSILAPSPHKNEKNDVQKTVLKKHWNFIKTWWENMRFWAC